MRVPSQRLLVLAVFLCPALSFLNSCGSPQSAGDVLGTAYVAPATLNLRRDLREKNTSGVLLKHGEPVYVLEIRRRFVRIRTGKGDTGWVDSLQLLSPDEMKNLQEADQRARELPSQGMASVYDPLNVHLEPSRQSPAFATIPQGGTVSVVAHRVEPKVNETPKPPNLIADRPQPTAHRSKKATRASLRLPPPPPAPKPPANWQELSAERIEGSSSTADKKAERDEKKAEAAKKPVVLEDWTLVRLKDNSSGWVLSRNLVMLIPDEVAQYAEGRRITSYFDLGEVQDEQKGSRHNWLWTTLSSTEPYDFDSWRVFLWNRRRHRYETSHRQRDVEGYFPVHVDPPDASAFGRTFGLITKDDDGRFRRRTYLFDGVRVHLTATENYHPGAATETNAAVETAKAQGKTGGENWLKNGWTSLKGRLSHKRQP